MYVHTVHTVSIFIINLTVDCIIYTVYPLKNIRIIQYFYVQYVQCVYE